ncbi:MAG: hypothetical protein HC822_02005 [Oscillochloris sp.]|nr:hypothetical protein [Oscillochloris sp.]
MLTLFFRGYGDGMATSLGVRDETAAIRGLFEDYFDVSPRAWEDNLPALTSLPTGVRKEIEERSRRPFDMRSMMLAQIAK